MSRRSLAAAFALAAALTQAGWHPSQAATEPAPAVKLSTASTVVIPKFDDLRKKIDATFRPPSSAKFYIRDGGKLVEAKAPPPAKETTALVQSFNEKDGIAQVQLIHPASPKPLVQIWHFDGKNWNNSVPLLPRR